MICAVAAVLYLIVYLRSISQLAAVLEFLELLLLYSSLDLDSQDTISALDVRQWQ